MRRKKDQEFRFKQFSVRHDQSTMKVGTDAVLLGAWMDLNNAKEILDMGTGSGVIALMLAQRSGIDSKIDAIEIAAESVSQAKENVNHSPWPEKINVYQSSFQEWKPGGKYDLIVSNPPFFSNSLLPPDTTRGEARHSISLTSIDLLSNVKRLLHANGRLAVVLPFAEGNQFIDEAKKFQFYLNRQLAFFTRQGKPQERWVLEFSFQNIPASFSSLTLYAKENILTEEYKQLTSDFYLGI